jgi:hypothetical protein
VMSVVGIGDARRGHAKHYAHLSSHPAIQPRQGSESVVKWSPWAN